MFRKKGKPKESGDLGGGLYLHLINDMVSLTKVYGYPFPPDVIKSIQVFSTEDVKDAILELKALASELKDYRAAFDGAL